MPQALKKSKNKRKTENVNVRSRKRSKSLLTKEKLISNARQVFTKTPYKTASVRDICSSHNLVWYHFGSKGNLFNALTSRIIEEVSDIIPSFVQGIDKMPPQKGLEHFVKQFLDYLFENPDSMKVINQNLGNCDESDIGFPGLDIMQAIHNQIFAAFLKIVPKHSSNKDLERWCLVFLIHIINFIGAMRANQVAFKLKPYRHVYQKWLENILVFLLFPSFNHLIVGPQAEEFEDVDIQIPREKVKPEFITSDKDKVQSKVKPKRKGEVTREEILKAARKVFTKHPYDAASFRMIGKQGNMDFTLIHHYFPTKEVLFREVAMALFDEVWKTAHLWHEGLTADTTIYNGFSIIQDRALDYFFHNHDAISFAMQNIANVELLGDAMSSIKYFNEYIEDQISSHFPVPKLQNQAKMWHIGLTGHYMYFLGASHYFARMLEMDSNGKAYKKWIKDTNVFIQYPILRRLILRSLSEQ